MRVAGVWAWLLRAHACGDTTIKQTGIAGMAKPCMDGAKDQRNCCATSGPKRVLAWDTQTGHRTTAMPSIVLDLARTFPHHTQ